jgi:hypothetical protein
MSHATLERPRRAPEFAFVSAAATTVALTALVAAPLAWLVAGTPGLAGAGAALGLLAVLYGLSATLHLITTGLGARAWVGVTAGGFAVRLVIYFVVLQGLDGVAALHTMSLALTAAAGILIGQVFEMRALTRARRQAAAMPKAGRS